MINKDPSMRPDSQDIAQFVYVMENRKETTIFVGKDFDQYAQNYREINPIGQGSKSNLVLCKKTQKVLVATKKQ